MLQQVTSFTSTVIQVPPALQPFVQCYMHTIVEGNTKNFSVDLFPVGYPVISITLNKNHVIEINNTTVTAPINITGQLTRHYKMKVQNIKALVYIFFTPMGVYKLFKIPQHYFTNNFLDVSSLHIGEFSKVKKKLLASNSPIEQKIDAINNWLLPLIPSAINEAKEALLNQLMVYIQKANTPIFLKDLYKQFGISKSSCERLFKDYIGLTPKEYISFIRFNKAYTIISNGGHIKWSDIVYQHHYFDQSHFIKEFKKMFGYTPNQMHQSITNIAKHVREEIKQQ